MMFVSLFIRLICYLLLCYLLRLLTCYCSYLCLLFIYFNSIIPKFQSFRNFSIVSNVISTSSNKFVSSIPCTSTFLGRYCHIVGNFPSRSIWCFNILSNTTQRFLHQLFVRSAYYRYLEMLSSVPSWFKSYLYLLHQWLFL